MKKVLLGTVKKLWLSNKEEKMNEYRGAEKTAFAVGLAIALSINVIMNLLHFVGLVG